MAVASNWVVEHFDIIENVLTCQFSGTVDLTFNAFAFKQLGKAFSNGIVVAISLSVHARL